MKEEKFNLSKHEMIIDRLISCKIHQLRLDSIEDIKKMLNEKYYPAEKVKAFIKELREEVDLLGQEVKSILNDNRKSFVSKESLIVNTVLSFYLKIQRRAGRKLI